MVGFGESNDFFFCFCKTLNLFELKNEIFQQQKIKNKSFFKQK